LINKKIFLHKTWSLTTGADTGASFVGGSADDIFTASTVAAGDTWSVGDAINGGAGNDIFYVTQTNAITKPTGSTVSNIENITMLSGNSITLDTTSGFSGLTSLITTSKSGATGTTLTAAATTDINETESAIQASGTSQLIIDGGKNVTVTATGTLTQATAMTVTTGANAEILVGASTAAAGDVVVTNSFKGANTNVSGDVFVKGGKTVSVTQKLTNTTTNETNVQGAVSVVGDLNTTAVTVNQDKTATASAVGTGVVGKTAGAVDINDKNAASATSAGSIAAVTLNNAGAAVVNSGALTTLNLGGSLVTVNAGTLGALTTPTITTLALNLTGTSSTGAVTIDSKITTLNISGNTTASSLNTLVASGAQKINVSGDAKVTLTNNTTAAVTDIVVTNTAGASFGTALGTAVNFAGGAGDDTILLTTNFTKAITLGAGNDTVTYAAQGTGGSVAAGDGVDTIIMTTANTDSTTGVSASSTFNTKFTGFETLNISNAHTTTADLDGINAVTKVILTLGSNGGTINNLINGGTIDILAANAGSLTVVEKSALVGASDVLNLNLKNTSGTAFNTVTAANVETVNISVADAATAGSAAVTHTMTLAATSATSVVVTGNNGLTLTNTNNTKITNFDASGVVANDTASSAGVAATTDTAALLAVTFASADNTATDTVNIKGGAGNDVLSGNIAKDNISGNAGIDYIYGDNQGTKAINTVALTNAAAGTYTVNVLGFDNTVTYTTSTTATVDLLVTAINANTSLKGLVVASNPAGNLVVTSYVDGAWTPTLSATGVGNSAANTATATGTAGTVAIDSIDGGAGADVLVGGGGADSLTGGAGSDTFYFLKGHSNQAALATITDYTYAVGGSSNDKIIIGDVVAAAGTVSTVQDFSAQSTLAAAFDAAALSNTGVASGLVVFLFGGNEYAYVETTAANTTYTTGDFAVKLVGTPIATGTALAGLGFDAV
jgi:S-layer protein